MRRIDGQFGQAVESAHQLPLRELNSCLFLSRQKARGRSPAIENEQTAFPPRRGSNPLPSLHVQLADRDGRHMCTMFHIGPPVKPISSQAKAREAGKPRIEGKEYVVQDGDVIEFHFNV